jgi:esterase/lipase superfamily enzyme
MLEHLLINLACKMDFVFKPLFKEVVLVAADTDWHGFEEEYAFEKLKLLSERITIYHHQGDLALYLSEMIQNKNKRLGRHGFRDCKKIRGQVYSVDCTSIIDDTGLMFKIVDHSYFQVSNTAINDIIYTLRGKPIDEFLSQSLRMMKSSSERAFRLSNGKR